MMLIHRQRMRSTSNICNIKIAGVEEGSVAQEQSLSSNCPLEHVVPGFLLAMGP